MYRIVDAAANVRVIRAALLQETERFKPLSEEMALKQILYSLAAPSSIVLDLHCDSEAVMHMYTHDRLWPALADLAAELQSECQLLGKALKSLIPRCYCAIAILLFNYTDPRSICYLTDSFFCSQILTL
jgi:hypothetical protein